MSREIRRKLDQGRGEGARAKDVLRASFENHAAPVREAQDRLEKSRAERVRQIWQDAVNEVNNGQEGA